MPFRLALMLAALSAASPALAWNTCGSFDATTAGGTAPGALVGYMRNGFRALCHDTTGTTASSLLTVDAGSVVIELEPDIDGSSTGCEVQAYRCRSRSATSSDLTSCTKILTDTDGDGIPNDTTLDGSTIMRRGISDERVKYLMIVVTQNTNSDQCRTMVSGY